MIPYIVVYFVCYVLSKHITFKKYNIFDYLLIAILVLFSGLRYGIGTDYQLYKTIFEAGSLSFDSMATSRTGFGYSVITGFLRSVCHWNFESFVLFSAAVTVALIYRFIKKNSINPSLSILCYLSLGFYTSSFNTLRQWLSFSLALTATDCLKEKRYCLFCVLSLISISIHSSMIIYLVISSIYIIRKKIHVKMIPLFVVSAILSLSLTAILGKYLVSIDAYKGYVDYDAEAGIGTYLNLVFYLILAFVVSKYRSVIIKKHENSRAIINIFITGVAIMIVQTQNWLFARLSVNMIFYSVLLIPLIAQYAKKKEIRLLMHSVLFVYYLFYVSSFGGIVPYATIL